MAPGQVITDMEINTIRTGFDDANLFIMVTGKHHLILREEEGWHAGNTAKGNRGLRSQPFTKVRLRLFSALCLCLTGDGNFHPAD